MWRAVLPPHANKNCIFVLCWKLKVKKNKNQTVFPLGACSVKSSASPKYIMLTLCCENLDYQWEESATTVTDYAWRSQGLLLFAQHWRARIKNSLYAHDVTGNKKWFFANEEIFLKRVITEKTTMRREWNSFDVSANFDWAQWRSEFRSEGCKRRKQQLHR